MKARKMKTLPLLLTLPLFSFAACGLGGAGQMSGDDGIDLAAEVDEIEAVEPVIYEEEIVEVEELEELDLEVEAAVLESDTYDVQEGDTLWSVADNPEVYADAHQWPLLYKANADIIDDSDAVFPGMTLVVPRDYTLEEIESAIEFARFRGAWLFGEVEQTDVDYLTQ